MSWMTIIWSMLASASIVIGMLHLFLWRRDVSRDFYLYSSLMAVTAATPVSNKYAATNHYPFTGDLDKVIVKLTD